MYKPGIQNRIVADALLHVHNLESVHFANTVPQLDFLAKLKEELKSDREFQGLIQKVQTDPSNFEHLGS